MRFNFIYLINIIKRLNLCQINFRANNFILFILFNKKMKSVFNEIRDILYNNYCINFDQIELEAEFELELGLDSRDFFELIEDFETIFKIDIFYFN